jgi:tRNA dimethylallyltransferase
MKGGRVAPVALYGPTSSGKTRLAVELAGLIRRQLGRETVVISADSRQVYRHLDIGTSKTTPEQMGGFRHELLDVAEPVRKLELEEYVRLARGQVDRCLADGVVPLLVGGTGVYVKAVLEGWRVDGVGTARDALRRDFPRALAGDAYATLRRLDRGAASRVHPNNYEAVINALAALTAAPAATGPPGPDPVVLGLDPGQRVLDRRVAETYDDQVRRGLYAEVSDLAARYDLDREFRRRGPDSANQVLHTHGYREYFEVAAGRGRPVDRLDARDLAEVRTRVVERIRGYTRRQRTWLGKLPGARVVDSAGQALGAVRAAVSGRSR